MSDIRIKIRALRIFSLLLRIYFSYRLLSFRNIFIPEEKRQEHLSRLHKKNAVLFRKKAVELKGILIKVGQFLSTRVDFLPREYTNELALLQDQVPPADFGEIKKRLVGELKRDLYEVFSRFNEIPIAAASLGQVHEALLLDGRRVAVKIQYPGIERVVRTDLKILRKVLDFLQRGFKGINFDILHMEFQRILTDELNYIQEGRNAETFFKNFAGDDRIVVPKVYWDYTTPKVLVLEYVEGIKITDYENIDASGIDKRELASLLVEAYTIQIARHRFFHGDPHPGNLFVQKGPKLVFVDFGLMQRITSQMRRYLRETGLAIIDRDIPGIIRGLVNLGFLSRSGDLEGIEKVVNHLIERYRDITPREFQYIGIDELGQEMQELLQSYPAIQIPNNFILLSRTLGMLNGICTHLDPDLNIIELAKPYVKKFVAEEEEGLFQRLITKGRDVGKTLMTLPEQMETIMEIITRGELKTKMSSEDVTGVLTKIYKLGHRLILSLLIIAFILAFIHFREKGLTIESIILGILIASFSLAFLWSFIRDLMSLR